MSTGPTLDALASDFDAATRGDLAHKARRLAQAVHAAEAAQPRRSERPRCGARTRNGERCKAPGNGRGGRCRRHGGASTGARSPAGRERQRAGFRNWLARREEKDGGHG
jgi:hypothetical protein